MLCVRLTQWCKKNGHFFWSPSSLNFQGFVITAAGAVVLSGLFEVLKIKYRALF